MMAAIIAPASDSLANAEKTTPLANYQESRII